MEQGMVALHAFCPVCGVASTTSVLAHWELIPIHRAELHCAVSLLNWNKAALLKDGSSLSFREQMLVRPFLLQNCQACVVWWQQRLSLCFRAYIHASKLIQSSECIHLKGFFKKKILHNFTQSVGLLLAGVQVVFNQAFVHGKVLSKYCWNDTFESRISDFILLLTTRCCLFSSVLGTSSLVYTKLHMWSKEHAAVEIYNVNFVGQTVMELKWFLWH